MKRYIYLFFILISLLFITACSSTKNIETDKPLLELEENELAEENESSETPDSAEEIKPIEEPEVFENEENETENTETLYEEINDEDAYFESNVTVLIPSNDKSLNDKSIENESVIEVIEEETSTIKTEENAEITENTGIDIENNSNAIDSSVTDLALTDENEVGLDISEENSIDIENMDSVEKVESIETTENEKKSNKSSEEVIISRSVKLMKNQYLDVLYPGSGWVYLGEVNDTEKLRYFGRKITEKDMLFSLRTKGEGKAILHFYKVDKLNGQNINDYLEVIISGVNTTQDRVRAPDYAEKVPPKNPVENIKPKNTEEKKTNEEKKVLETENKNEHPEIKNTQNEIKENLKSSEGTVTEENKTSSDASLSNDEVLKLAKECFNRKDYKAALDYINQYLANSVSMYDEALFYKAQILEAPSSYKNIKQAIECYEKIVKEYPKSSYWKKANERATYLKRFYLNVR